MGTRSLTFFYGEENNETPILALYRQFDGYISGHGVDIANFLENMTLVNGYTQNEVAGTHANGMGCLAAQFIALLKTGIGEIYVTNTDTEDDWNFGIDYTYHIRPDSVKVYGGAEFEGTWKEYVEFVKNEV